MTTLGSQLVALEFSGLDLKKFDVLSEAAY
jgi:hypothetical protein